ncbi:ATP-binding protein [Arcobacter sp.]|uniref:ATP-binding protein n=1 Tax=Arcobacter sp. TaxID=1872629 RepID=UPI003D0C6853
MGIFNRMTSLLSIKQIIVTTILLISFIIITILGALFFSISRINENQKSIATILKLEKQNELVLKKLDSILEGETDILTSKDEKSFRRIKEYLFKANSSIELQRLKNSKYDLKYNVLIDSLEDNLQYAVELQKDFFNTGYTIFTLKMELKNHLEELKKEIRKIQNLYEQTLIQLHLIEEKEYVNNIERKIQSLYTFIRDAAFENNQKEVDEIKNKLKNMDKLIFETIKTTKASIDNKILFKFISEVENCLININYLEYSIISAKVEIFEKEEFLSYIKTDRKENFLIINNNINDISKITDTIITDNIDNSEKISNMVIILSIVIGIFSILGLIFISIILISRINNPLEHIIKMINDILENKVSLSKNIEVRYKDEFKELVDVFNHMTRSLDKNIKNLKERDEEISLLNKDLEKRVALRTQELSEKNQKIIDLFNNAKQGFLSLNRDLIIDEEHSKECEILLGDDISNRKIDELLVFESEHSKSFFNQTLKDILREKNEIIQNSFIELLPKELIINRRAISIDYKRLNDKKLMLIFTNITHKKKLERKIKKEQQLLKMIVTIISDTMQFYELINDFKKFDNNKLKIFELNNNPFFNLGEIYREIHTFKGLFSQLYMSNSVKNLHDFESKISEYINDKNFTNKELKKLLEENSLLDWIDEDLEIIKSILGGNFLEEDSIIKVNEETIIHLEDKIKNYCQLDKKHVDNYEDILFEAQKLRSKTLYQALKAYPNLCKDLAESLGKQIYTFEILGDKRIILPPDFKPFIKSLIHVFRNLLDHGIEDMETRLEQGKNEKGTIVCNFNLENDFLFILISDDGRGISRDRIREKVKELDLMPMEEFDKMSDERVFGLIFYETFSTKEEITELSGRGIGMAVVKNELTKLDGSVEVKSEINKGTTFIFKLPYKRKAIENV